MIETEKETAFEVAKELIGEGCDLIVDSLTASSHGFYVRPIKAIENDNIVYSVWIEKISTICNALDLNYYITKTNANIMVFRVY